MSRPLSFQEAIAQSTEWIRLWDQDELSDDVLADEIGALVRERDGARGFFVASLTSDSPLMDRLPEPLIYQLRLAGEGVVDLTVRNLAMSTAMGVHHKRNHDQSLLDGSMRVRSRCVELLRVLDSKQVKNRLEILADGINAVGEDTKFLQRWGYDDEQIEEIQLAINEVAT
jgi:hypothetical protein